MRRVIAADGSLAERPSGAEIVSLFDRLLRHQGYICIGTKPGVEPWAIGHTVSDLFEFPQDRRFEVFEYTDGAEYDAQVDLIARWRTNWPPILRSSRFEGGHFYRVKPVEVAS